MRSERRGERSLSTMSVDGSVTRAADGPVGIVGSGGGVGAAAGHRRTASRDRPLGSRSVGFPGFGPILEGHEASALSRGSAANGANLPAGGTEPPLGRGSVGNLPAPMSSSSSSRSPVPAAAAGGTGRTLNRGKGGSYGDLPSLDEDEPEALETGPR